MNFSEVEYDQRLKKTRKAMISNGVDVLVVCDPSNMHWLSGYDGWSFYVAQAVVVFLDKKIIWWGRPMDAAGVGATTTLSSDLIYTYSDDYVQNPQKHPYSHLVTILERLNVSSSRIGVEMDNYYFSARSMAVLNTELPNAKFVDATGLVNWQRSVKSPQELEYMRRAGIIVGKMHERIRNKLEPGMRKCDLVAEIYDAAIRGTPEFGGDYPAIVPLLPSGSDAAAAHLTWDDSPMKSGEGTFFEIAGVYRRYHCPISRSAFIGNPPDKYLEAHKAVMEGLEAGLEKARPGNLCEDMANSFFGVLKKYDIHKDSRCGYPIGLSYPPDWGERTMSLRPGDKSVLETGMTFHFMPGLWMDDWGLEVTESFIIGESGPELLADITRELVIFSSADSK
jgi:ectoine hydrolase